MMFITYKYCSQSSQLKIQLLFAWYLCIYQKITHIYYARNLRYIYFCWLLNKCILTIHRYKQIYIHSVKQLYTYSTMHIVIYILCKLVNFKVYAVYQVYDIYVTVPCHRCISLLFWFILLSMDRNCRKI